TVAAWIKPSDVNQFAPIIEKRQNSGSFEEFSMVIKDNDSHAATPGRRISCLLIENAGVTERSAYTTNNVVDGAWHHVECVWDSIADNYYIFVDGVSVSITKDYNLGSWPTVNNTDPLQFSNESDSVFFNGPIDDVRVSNTALSSSWIQTEYNNQSSPSTFESFGVEEPSTGYQVSNRGGRRL